MNIQKKWNKELTGNANVCLIVLYEIISKEVSFVFITSTFLWFLFYRNTISTWYLYLIIRVNSQNVKHKSETKEFFLIVFCISHESECHFLYLLLLIPIWWLNTVEKYKNEIHLCTSSNYFTSSVRFISFEQMISKLFPHFHFLFTFLSRWHSCIHAFCFVMQFLSKTYYYMLFFQFIYDCFFSQTSSKHSKQKSSLDNKLIHRLWTAATKRKLPISSSEECFCWFCSSYYCIRLLT